jgi:two-component system LytT family sensor kinase
MICSMKRQLASALVIFVLSTAVGLYFASQAAFAWPVPVREPWRVALAKNLAYYWAWGAAVPIVAMLGRRFPFGSGWKMSYVFVHLVAAVAVTIAEIAVPALALSWVGIYQEGPVLTFLRVRVLGNFHSSFPTYWLILFVVLTLDYHAKYRNRHLRAASLEWQLAGARLDALRMQLNPHFLFNALNSISAVMYTDPAAADSMVRNLGDLLRVSLNENRNHEIPLKQEVEFVERYLDIERVRFDERLQVRIDVAPETLGAFVPTLVLQPVVENALRHAIAPRAAGGTVTIAARLDRALLRLSVSDDGPGIPDNRMAEGVGLANTRARLEQLYGLADPLRLVLSPTEPGLRVEMLIPFRTEPTYAAAPVRSSAYSGGSLSSTVAAPPS